MVRQDKRVRYFPPGYRLMQRDLGISLGCGIGGALASDQLGSNFKLGHYRQVTGLVEKSSLLRKEKTFVERLRRKS
jgi:hypothetical protein